MKVERVKVYQAVQLGKHVETMFPGRKVPNVDMEVLEGIGVKISDATNTIVVPFPNVAYFIVKNTPTTKAKIVTGKHSLHVLA